MQRVILHCDANSFFASVEERKNPELKKVPMAVVGDEKNRHGIILAKNLLAKEKGVQTPEPIWQAKRKCPNLVLVPPHYAAYADFSPFAFPIMVVKPLKSNSPRGFTPTSFPINAFAWEILPFLATKDKSSSQPVW